MKRQKSDNTITIPEEIQIPGTDMILEKGDQIEVQPLKESLNMEGLTPYPFYADYYENKEDRNYIMLKANNSIDPDEKELIDTSTAYQLRDYNENPDGSVSFSVRVWEDDSRTASYITWFSFDSTRDAQQAGW